jgi:DeoR/GlpR family transcriptional regulator of sugar metabolism
MADVTLRAEFILQELRRNGRVDADDLSKRLLVNASTIRRDLERLEKQNLLRRIHGGAVPVDAFAYSAYGTELTFQKNMQKQLDEKARIAQAALQLIEPGESIALSPGTTTTYLARAIRQAALPNLNVVTNAVNIAMELVGLPGLSLTLIGGLLLPDFFALVGPSAEQHLGQIYVSKAFMGVTGVHPIHGLTGPNPLEALTHRVMLQRAQQVIVLADHTKLDRVALNAIAPVSAFQTLITDSSAPPELLAQFRDSGISVREV